MCFLSQAQHSVAQAKNLLTNSTARYVGTGLASVTWVTWLGPARGGTGVQSENLPSSKVLFSASYTVSQGDNMWLRWTLSLVPHLVWGSGL